MVAVNVPSARAPREAMAFLPPGAPRDMPAQKLNEAPHRPLRTGRSPAHAARRLLMLSTTIALTILAAYEMYYVLEVGGITAAEATVLGLFVALFAWIAYSSFSAIAGFFVLLFGRTTKPVRCDTQLSTRTALLFPVYNEEPHPVLRRVRAMYEAIAAAGFERHFDVFILSDTTDPDIWVLEEKLLLDLRREDGFASIFYRHRAKNVARKSGNIQEWICAFGGGYDSMIILDADSVMTAESVVQLASAMERTPDAALIQTLPVIVNAQSLFARLQQFAGRLYGPMIAAGIAWWHGSESNYWGHNAIIRISAFAEHAGLPELHGRKPFGGHVLSHDFVEAALMRRSGWGIYMAHRIGGSYEECPPTPLDYAARDRRWCQGNLQHIALLGTRGLHWLSRLHLLTGIGSYLTAPMWLAFLLLGIAISLQAQFVRPEYFPSGFSLFPKWPAQDPIRAMWVFGGTMALLLAPKLLAFLLVLLDADRRRAFGGAALTGAGVVAEILLSGLLAPAMMVFQSIAVADILLGRDSGWQVQSRAGGAVAMSQVLQRFAVPTALGVAMAVAAWLVSLSLFLWMTPVIVGLLVAIPLAVFLSTPSAAMPGRRRLLATPEELSPDPLLVAAACTAAPEPREPVDGFTLLRNDPALRDAHVANLPNGSARRRGEIEERLVVATAKIDDAESFAEAAGFLTRQEKLAVLGSEAALRKLLAKPPA